MLVVCVCAQQRRLHLPHNNSVSSSSLSDSLFFLVSRRLRPLIWCYCAADIAYVYLGMRFFCVAAAWFGIGLSLPPFLVSFIYFYSSVRIFFLCFFWSCIFDTDYRSSKTWFRLAHSYVVLRRHIPSKKFARITLKTCHIYILSIHHRSQRSCNHATWSEKKLKRLVYIFL